MKRSAIRHLATSPSGVCFAAAEFESKVSIWNINTKARISEFQAFFDSGGNRLAIDPLGERCVAGAYVAKGIACYHPQTGAPRWFRKDLKKVQTIGMDPLGNEVFCGFDTGPLRILDIRDGATVEELRGCRNLVSSPYEPVRLAEKGQMVLQSSVGTKIAQIERETFGLLSSAFGPGLLVTSESGGPVRCFDTKSGRLIWRYNPEKGCHFLKVGYHQRLRKILGVEWSFETGGAKTLVIFDETVGLVQARFPLGTSECEEFGQQGEYLLSSAGWMLQTESGQLAGSFDFPLKDHCQ